jgi:hypothetical protein
MTNVEMTNEKQPVQQAGVSSSLVNEKIGNRHASVVFSTHAFTAALAILSPHS